MSYPFLQNTVKKDNSFFVLSNVNVIIFFNYFFKKDNSILFSNTISIASHPYILSEL